MSTVADRFLEDKMQKQRENAEKVTAESSRRSETVVAGTPVTQICTKTAWYSVKGRLNRLSYFLRIMILFPVALVGLGIMELSNEIPGILLGLAIIIYVSITGVFQEIKRLHDVGMSGWFCLIGMIPIVNAIFGLYVLFFPGDSGTNQYGDRPI